MSSKFQTKIKKQYQKEGYTVTKYQTTQAGYPDLLCTKQNEVDIYIECKEEKDTLKSLQKFRIDQLIKSGKKAFCIQDKKGIIYPNNKENNINLDF
jgi:Holliday junction resolvase